MKFKNLSCCFIVFMMVFCLIAGVYANDEKTYDVTYKEFNVYRSEVLYEQNYNVVISDYEILLGGNENFEVSAKLNGNDVVLGETNSYEKIPGYFISLINTANNKVIDSVNSDDDGVLKDGQKIVILQKKDADGKIIHKYKLTITVKSYDNYLKPITDIKTVSSQDWIKIEKPIGWTNYLKYGNLLPVTKKYINLGETKEFITSKDVYSIGAAKFLKKEYLTLNKKLLIGDNSLFAFNKTGRTYQFIKYTIGKKDYWFKVEFVINLAERLDNSPITSTDISPSPTISTDITPSSSTTNTNDIVVTTPTASNNTVYSNTSNTSSGLPQTGEEEPSKLYSIIGCIVLLLGGGLFIVKLKKLKRQS